MELDDHIATSDEQRRLAESKKLTLQPLHANITPDDLPDSVISASHLNAPAIANLPLDVEQNSELMQPAPGAQPIAAPAASAHRPVIITAATILVVGLVAFVLI